MSLWELRVEPADRNATEVATTYIFDEEPEMSVLTQDGIKGFKGIQNGSLLIVRVVLENVLVWSLREIKEETSE